MTPATFQALNSHIWLEASVIEQLRENVSTTENILSDSSVLGTHVCKLQVRTQ